MRVREVSEDNPPNIIGGFHAERVGDFERVYRAIVWEVSPRAAEFVGRREALDGSLYDAGASIGSMDDRAGIRCDANVTHTVCGVVIVAINAARSEHEVAGGDAVIRNGFAVCTLLDGAPWEPHAALSVEPLRERRTIRDSRRLAWVCATAVRGVADAAPCQRNNVHRNYSNTQRREYPHCFRGRNRKPQRITIYRTTTSNRSVLHGILPSCWLLVL